MKPLKLGEIGIRNLHEVNKALGARLTWCLYTLEGSLRSQTILTEYHQKGNVQAFLT
jgi:hypothetical protein